MADNNTTNSGNGHEYVTADTLKKIYEHSAWRDVAWVALGFFLGAATVFCIITSTMSSYMGRTEEIITQVAGMIQQNGANSSVETSEE